MSAQHALRVAHIITSLEVGGAETALQRLLLASDPSILESRVWSLRDVGSIGRQLLDKGIPVRAMGMSYRPSTFGAWQRLRQEVDEFCPDIIQGWMYHANIIASLLHRSLRTESALVWNVRASLQALDNEKQSTRMVIAATRLMARSPDRIVNNSRASVEDHLQIGYPRAKCIVIPNGFDTNRFRPQPERQAELRQHFGMNADDAALLGVIGRNHPIKGHRYFIEAVRQLDREGIKVKGVLAGPGWEPTSAAARDLARADPSLFICMGTVARTELLLPALDVLCLPSLAEGFPNILGEAMSCSVPCVATDVGDVSVLGGGTVEVVGAGDARALAVAMSRWLRTEPTVRHKRCERSRQRIVEMYSQASSVSAYQSLYTSLAERFHERLRA